MSERLSESSLRREHAGVLHADQSSNFDKKSQTLTVERSVSSTDPSDEESLYVPTPLTWKGRIWDAWDKPPEERWFLFKLDATLLLTGCIGVFLRYLDQANLTNAFVSGMKEELNMYGNELNYASMLWSVGYVLGQLPSNLIITKVKPHYWLPILEILWSIITFATSRVENMSSLYALRFLLGFIESGHFPGIMYITVSWYTKTEVAKRMGIIQFCTGVGPMFSGYLQAAAHNGLNGVGGLAGWRWLFIVDGIISLPLAILAFFMLPDVPRMQSSNWLFKEKELKLARKRVPTEAKIHVTYKWKDVISWFQTWHIYLFPIIFSLLIININVTAQMSFWLKSYNTPEKQEYSVYQINVYPTGVQAVQIVSTIIYCYISDNLLKGKRAPVLIGIWVIQFAVTLGLVLVPVHPAHKAGRWLLYYLTGGQGGSGAIAWTWVNESMLGEPVKRAFVSSFMNSVGFSFSIWVPLLLFPTKDLPFVTKGNIVVTVLAVLVIVLAGAIWYIQSLKLESGFFRSVPPPNAEEEEVAPAEI